MSSIALINEYIDNVNHEIYNLFPAKDFLAALRTDVENFVSEFPQCTYSDIVEQFGSPEFVARDFIESSDSHTPKEKAAKKKRLQILLVVLIIAALACIVYSILLSSQRQVMYDDVITIESNE